MFSWIVFVLYSVIGAALALTRPVEKLCDGRWGQPQPDEGRASRVLKLALRLATIAFWPVTTPLASWIVQRLAERQREGKRCALAERLTELQRATTRELTFPEFHELRSGLDRDLTSELLKKLDVLGFTVCGVLSEGNRVTRMSIRLANALCQPIALTGRTEGHHGLGSLEEEDEVWDFMTSPESWKNLCGLAGSALVRNGVVTDIRSVMEN